MTGGDGVRGLSDNALTRWFAELNHQGIFATDVEIRVTMWNRWMEMYSGLTRSDVLGRSLFELFPDVVERGLDQYYQLARRGQISLVSFGLHKYVLPLPHTSPDIGLPYMPQSARIGPLWEEDAVAGTVTLIDDVSDRLGTELELRKQIQAQQLARATAERALRAKDEFLSTLSHEIRQPLNAVLGWTRILRDRSEVEPDLLSRALSVIDRNATLQARLIDDLLDMARIVAGKLRLEMQPVDLVAVARAAVDVVQPAAINKGITIRTTVDASLPRILGDMARLQQIIWNLLANAVKFSNPDGAVELTVERTATGARLTVRDNGRGISPEFLPYVFERFRQADASSTRREGGLGLGLALVRELVELHGGRVSAASDGPEKGATFRVELPAAGARDAAQNLQSGDVREPDASLLSGVRVLVVEDEADSREMIATALAESGAEVITACSCAAALAALEAASPDRRPHVLVSDIGMPGEDGYALMLQVRGLEAGRGGRIPAIAITGYSSPEDRDRILAAGYQLYLPKPVDPVALAAAVAGIVGGEI
jgi:signal transduction histidine kinase/CheY-like chemotaxis protein